MKLKKSLNTIPITVRQLEAVIRLSESLAKMKLKSEVGL
jgi:DNA replicative helicase MCM subunit Mcm2 (Cdc46/Mcm family)